MTIPRSVHANEPEARNLKALVNGKDPGMVVYADVDRGYVIKYATVPDFTKEEMDALARVGIVPFGDNPNSMLRHPNGDIAHLMVSGSVEIVRADEDDGN